MRALTSRAVRAVHLRAALTEPDQIADALDGTPVPDQITDWLGRLHALHGVPFGYLVPSEDMLPPESVRFFRLDPAWTEALIDGAFSLGRNLTLDATTNPTAAIDGVVLGPLTKLARQAVPVHRMPRRLRQVRRVAAAEASGGRTVLRLRATDGVATTGPNGWTGFLLRSAVVPAYPGLGVNAYPAGHTPDDSTPIPLEVTRLERLGPNSDTLFCLVAGDQVAGEAVRYDIHEAPEQLHYGLDTFTVPIGGGVPTATKYVHAFDRADDGTITFGHQEPVDVDLTSSLRPESSRVIDFGSAAQTIATGIGFPTPLDSAQLGFAMTAGVGMLSYLRRQTPAPPSGPTPSETSEGLS